MNQGTRQAPRTGTFYRLASKALVAAAALFLLAGAPLTSRSDLPTVAAKASFYTPRTTVWLGRTQVVPFHLAAPAESDLTLLATPANAAVVEVLRHPAVLLGETTGYLRLRGVQAGTTRLTLQGGAAIDLEVRADPAGAAFASVDAESRQPSIISPMPGAVVWDRFTVGVELFDNAPRPQAHDQFHVTGISSPGPEGVKVQLRLPDGTLLDPVDQGPGPEFGPVRHLAFEVNAACLRPGAFRLTAVAILPAPAGLDHRGAASRPLESEPLPLIAHAPVPGSVWVGEAESAITEPREVLAPARPSRFGTRQPKVEKDPNASGGQIVACNSNDPAWCLPFIVKNPGDYQMFIQGRGDFAAGAYPTVALHLNSVERAVGIVRLASSRYHRLPVGAPVHLDAGPQILTVQFKNDFQEGKEDRNFYFDRYELQRVGDTGALSASSGLVPASPSTLPQDAPPLPASALAQSSKLVNTPAVASLLPTNDLSARLNILYPANGSSVFGADMVVAFVANHTRIDWADLVIDGQAQNLRRLLPLPGEAIVFPLLVRSLAPGSHRLGVRASDANGHVVDSPLQLLTVSPEAPAKPGSYDRAVRLLDRFGFGPEPKELAAVLTLSETTWLNNRLGAGYDTPGERALLNIANTRYPQIEDGGQTIFRALTQWVGSENPVRTRFTAWAENHFSTWMEKITPFTKWREHLAFCRVGVAPFSDLLDLSSQSPAMLTYLDQEKSFAGKLNENYAREIMELHTLGVHSGYRQTDVTSLASLLNGWTLAEEAVLLHPGEEAPLKVSGGGGTSGLSKNLRFVPSLNDGKPQRVLGLDFLAADAVGRHDRIRLAIEMLAAHPSTADHVCRQLAEHYMSVPAPDDLVRDLAAVYLHAGGDLRAVLRSMAAHPSFWTVGPKVATPLDFALKEARLCRAAITEIGGDPAQGMKPDQIEAFLKRSGMGLFDHISPEGYSQNSAAYSDSNALLQRWRFVQSQADALNRLVPAHWRNVPTAAEPAAAVAQRFIDLAAVRLTGRLLSAESNQAALDLLVPDPSPAVMRQVLVFISMLPENNLR